MRIVIDVWIDFDPWSSLGFARLCRAARESAHDVVVDVHSFPAADASLPADAASAVAGVAEREGVAMSADVISVGLPFTERESAHLAMHSARLRAADAEERARVTREFARNAMDALLTGSPIALDSPTGAHLAGAPGSVARGEATATTGAASAPEPGRLAPGAAESLARDIEDAKRLRIRGLPFAAIAGRILVMGAQSEERYGELIDEAAQAIDAEAKAEASPQRHHIEV